MIVAGIVMTILTATAPAILPPITLVPESPYKVFSKVTVYVAVTVAILMCVYQNYTDYAHAVQYYKF